MKRPFQLYLLIIPILLVVGYLWSHHPIDRFAMAKNADRPLKKTAPHSTQSQVSQQATSTAQNSMDGHPAPAFKLPMLNGNVKSLSSYRGSLVLFISWATWCTECRQELDNLKAKSQKETLPYQIVLVNMTSEEMTKQDVNKFIRDNDVAFPVLLDPKGHFESAYRVRVIPTSFLIDEYGNVLHTFYGPINQKEVQPWIPASS